MNEHYTIPLPPVTKKNSSQIVFAGAKCPVCKRGRLDCRDKKEVWRMTTTEYLQREIRRAELSVRRAERKPNTPPEGQRRERPRAYADAGRDCTI